MFKVVPFEKRKLVWWFENRRLMNLAPPYQRRGGIWTMQTRRRLIDSILNRFDLPKFYIADLAPLQGPEYSDFAYSVIDGKQRFETIFSFFRDELTLTSKVEYGSSHIDLSGIKYSELARLHPDLAARFDNFEIAVMIVATDDSRKINELFVRLNSSAPLNGAEVRNAMPGVVPPVIRELAQHEFFQSRVRFATERAQDLNTCAKLLATEYAGAFVDVKKKNLDSFVSQFDDAEPTSGSTRGRESVRYDKLWRAVANVQRGLDVMASAFHEADDLLAVQGPVLDFYWLFRSRNLDNPRQLRDRLVVFDTLRRATADLDSDDVRSGKRRLFQRFRKYSDARRNANDKAAIQVRFEILDHTLDGLPDELPRPVRRFWLSS